MNQESQKLHRLCRLAAAAAALAISVLAGPAARAAEPITIGFGMALTGGLAAGGKTALLAMQIWQGDVNAKGVSWAGRSSSFLRRPDQSADGAGDLYQLLDVDKVAVIVPATART
jgi:branched-chain amino acid transport system substrate-binding protein